MPLTAREPRWNPTEEQFMTAVAQYARYHGWLVAHFRPARNGRSRGKRWHTPVQFDGAGFPDLVLARDGEIIFAELKSERGRLQPNQRRWIERLASAGAQSVEVHVWRPRDWEHIQARLGRQP